MTQARSAVDQLADTMERGEPGHYAWSKADFYRIQEKVQARTAYMSPEARTAYQLIGWWPQEYWPRPAPGPYPRKVAIVGKATGDVSAPWGREGWELWGLNDPPPGHGYPPLEAHTRWFQIHSPSYMERHYPAGIDFLAQEWKRDRGVRLYMDCHYPEYPNSEAYPRAEVEALTPHGRYHASSIDWMMALAILEGFQEIALYGIGVTTMPLLNGEPLSARSCLEYWSGVAEGRGAQVTVYGAGWMTDMFQTIHLARISSTLQYGLDNEPALGLGGEWRDVR